MVNLFYQRPSAAKDSNSNGGKCTKKRCTKIPPALSFDRIINGETCYPCRLQDFMLYCYFIERCSENIKFFLWYRTYCEQFEALPEEEKALSPPWTGIEPTAIPAVHDNGNVLVNHTKYGSFQTLVSQPFRSEISRVTSLFLFPGASLELNLSSRDRSKVLKALSFTTHPSALLPAFETVETALRWQSHPAFARRCLANANKERKLLLLSLSCVLAGATVLMMIFMLVSNIARPWRGFPVFTASVAVTAYVSQLRAFCFACYLKGRRDREPWDSNLDLLAQEKGGSSDDLENAKLSSQSRAESRASSFDYDEKSAQIHVRQFESQPFIKRGLKWGGRIKETSILSIQRTMFLQTVLMFLGSFVVFSAVFLPLPAVDLL